jgi:pentatricopeptide repeat protein
VIGKRVSHYEIQEPLGQGGMGEVWAARDVRLGRRVALKRVRTGVLDDRMRKRLWREARSAAAVNHPHVCQVYDMVEEDGELYLAMELLEGESLARRMSAGALPVPEALRITGEMLRALEAVHAAGLVHRDLKPGNIILTRHGLKLLDFGLSRTPPGGATLDDSGITREGQAVGTPRYMSPEQWAGEGIGPESDTFAAGAILYEMLTGQPAIAGTTIREVMEDCLRGHPPALRGDPEVLPLGAVIERALARDGAARYASARAMREELESVTLGSSPRIEAAGDRFTRVMVLPFRLLRPDPEVDFLTFSLPDAIVASLSSLDSVVVCSGARIQGGDVGPPDVAAIARQMPCHAVLFGNILRAGPQVRVTSQLVEAPSGTVLRAHTSEGRMDDIFRLQDDLARDIVASLPIDVSSRERSRLGRNRPSSGKAYELYLRANQAAAQRRTLPEACELYRRCLELDPQWAPAWARLGRAHRVMAKYSQGGDPEENFARAQEAFRRSLELDPDLSVAHNLYTFFEVEELGRSREAMARLLERAKTHSNDPQLFAGLVLTLRFCGLLNASVAADRRARHLDPGVRTSVHYTYELLGEWDRAIEYDDEDMKYVTRLCLLASGRVEEAARLGKGQDVSRLPGLERHVILSGQAAVRGDREACLESVDKLLVSTFRDPEGRFYLVRNLCRVGELDRAVSVLAEVVERGFHPLGILDKDPWLEPLRDHPRMPEVIRRLEEGIAAARTSYTEAGGPALLGVS